VVFEAIAVAFGRDLPSYARPSPPHQRDLAKRFHCSGGYRIGTKYLAEPQGRQFLTFLVASFGHDDARGS
jgi:hypothetical protein